MLRRLSIRKRIIFFNVLALLLVAALLSVGLFAVFGKAVLEGTRQLTRGVATEAVLAIEREGAVDSALLERSRRDHAYLMVLDADGVVLAESGSGRPPGTTIDRAIWGETAATNSPSTYSEHDPFDSWDDSQDLFAIVPVSLNRSPVKFVVAGINLDRAGQTQYSTVTAVFLGLGVLTFAAITFGSIWLVRYSLRPVTTIAEAATAISAEDLSKRLPVDHGRDELSQLATTFNGLLDRLEAAFREREEALAYQRRFVADASHELRTPLTSIVGYTRLLQKWGMSQPEASAESLERLEGAATRMQALVEGLLTLARGDDGGVLEPKAVDLVALAQSVIADFDMAVGVPIRFDAPAAPVVAWVDPLAARQVLTVLLDNARTHAAESPEIEVAVEASGGRATMRVSDSGPGIPEADRERIFERFARLEAARTTRGAGLGLAITRDLVERSGGSIAVTESSLGGSCFVVTLPAQASTERLKETGLSS